MDPLNGINKTILLKKILPLSPVKYLALKLCEDDENSYQKLRIQINDLYKNLRSTNLTYKILEPTVYQLVAVYVERTDSWHRGRIHNLYYRTNHVEAKVFLVDTLEFIQAPTKCLKKLDAEFSKIPFRCIVLHLDVLRSETSTPDLAGTMQSCNSEAISSVNRLLEDYCNFKFVIKNVAQDGSFSGRLLMKEKHHDAVEVCLNELLKERGIAISEDGIDTKGQKARLENDRNEYFELRKRTNNFIKAALRKNKIETSPSSSVTSLPDCKDQQIFRETEAIVAKSLLPRDQVDNKSQQHTFKMSSEIKVGSLTRENVSLLSTDDLSSSNSNSSLQSEILGEEKILRIGDAFPRAIKSLQSTEFDETFIRHLGKIGINKLRPTQANVWPAIQELRDLTVIAPKNSGKTTSYLVPLIWHLHCKKMSRPPLRGKHSGPQVIILCSNWQSAQKVFDQCEKITKYYTTLEVKLLHAGVSKDIKNIFFRSYDILVCTPTTLMRQMNDFAFNLVDWRHLCHLILDDADNLLTSCYKQVRKILQVMRLDAMRENFTPSNHLVMCSEKWTNELQKVMETCMINSLFCCASLFEAWVFARLTTVAHMLQPDEKLELLLNLVQQATKTASNSKIVVCSKSDGDIMKIQSSLAEEGLEVFRANSEMSVRELEVIRTKWAKSRGLCILLCADRCIRQLGIHNADWLIHYDIPTRSKGHFSIRLLFLLDDMHNSNQINKVNDKSQSKCQVHILLTQDCHYQSRTLVLLFQRLGCKVPSELKALSLGFYESKESEKILGAVSIPLCYRIKAFGCCKNSYWCSERHLLNEATDAPSAQFLKDHYVLVDITFVDGVNCFYGHILKHKKQYESSWMDVCDQYNDLKVKMMYHFCKSNSSATLQSNSIEVGSIYAFVDEKGDWHRVRVLNSSFQQSDDKQVFFIDSGQMRVINSKQMMKLPPHLLQLPSTLMTMYLCNIAPPDNEDEWLPEHCHKVKQMLEKRQVIGKIALSLGDCLWLNTVNVVSRTEMDNLCNEFNVIKKCINENFAMENPKHIPLLISFIETVFSSNETPLKSSNLVAPNALSKDESTCEESNSSDEFKEIVKVKPSEEIDCENSSNELTSLDEPVETNVEHVTLMNVKKVQLDISKREKVFVAAVEDPYLFCVQKVDTYKILKSLEESLKKDFCHLKTASLICGHVYGVMVKSGISKKYFRGELLELDDATKVGKVLLVDYGLVEDVEYNNIRNLEKKHFELEFQAIQCSLSGVQPIDDSTWLPEAGDLIWTATRNKKSGVLSMLVEPLNEQDGVYEVHLCEPNNNDLNIAKLLCSRGLAKPNNSNIVIEEVNKENSELPAQCEDEPPQLHFKIKQLPNVKWSTTKNDIRLKILVNGIKDYTLKVTGSRVYFGCVVNEILYEFDEEFFDELECKPVTSSLDPVCLVFRLKKVEAKEWCRLLKTTNKLKWLQADLDHLELSSSDEENYFSHQDVKKVSKVSPWWHAEAQSDHSQSDLSSDDDDSEFSG